MRQGGVAGALACALALSSCSLGEVIGDRDTSGPRVAKVIVLVPDGAPEVNDGAGVVAAAERALANSAPDGWTVEVQRVDHGTGSSVVAAAEEVAGDRDVIAVIGGLSSEVVRATQPIMDRNGIPFISPADGVPEHTRGPDPSAPQRPYETYFRSAVVGEDPEGLAARYAVNGLGAAEVAVMQRDRVDEAARFASHARSLGVGVQAMDPESIASVPAVARENDLVAVYAAGDASFAAGVVTEIVRSGLGAWVIGGEQLRTDEFLDAAGTAATRSVAVTPSTLEPTAGRRVPGLPAPGRYGAAAYDAAAALAETFERCLPPAREGWASSARKGCLAELGSMSFEGVTGTVSFDAYGDRQGAWPQAHVVVDGAWREVGTL